MQFKINFIISFKIYKLITTIIIKLLIYLRKADNINDLDFSKFKLL